MPAKIFICSLGMLLATSASAQAGPVARVSSDELVCKLSGDCAKTDASLDTQDKPGSRGFSIAQHSGAKSATAAPAAAVQAGHYVAAPARAVSGQSHIAPRPGSAPAAGRADLSINFVSGSAVLTDSGKLLAQTFMEALRAPQLAGKRFTIAGHTDAVGSRAYNIDLSQRRAQALVDYLVQQGANTGQFEVKGYGFDQPVPGSSANAASNRRVEVVTLN